MLLRIHFMQQWFTLSDPAMEEALHDMPLFRDFVGLSWDSAVPDESTILRFRHLLETHKLAEQILKTVTDLLESKKLLLRKQVLERQTELNGCIDPAVSAQVRLLKHKPQRGSSCPAPDEGAGGYKSRIRPVTPY